MRRKIYDIISITDENDIFSKCYDIFMIIAITLSLIPLFFKHNSAFFNLLDKVCVSIFILDYLFRWLTADYKFKENKAISFVKYPFSLMALIDLISILPSLTILNSGFKLLRLFRMLRAFRVVRAFKLLRYSKNASMIMNVFNRQKVALSYVLALAIAYIVISALVIFNVEPTTFDSFFDAIYWATVSLTTVGYGDLYPVTTIGRTVAMVSSLFGIAIIALPAGIITAGYMNELRDLAEDKDY